MNEPEGRPLDIFPVDFYIRIAKCDEKLRSLLERRYYDWFISQQLPAWQGTRESKYMPDIGDISTVKYKFDGQFWEPINLC